MTKGIDKYSIDSTDYTVGQDNVQRWGFDVHNPVFGISAGLVGLFLVAALVLDAHTMKTALDVLNGKSSARLTGCLFGRAIFLSSSVWR